MNEFIRIIPCLDVDNGRVVKGVNFVGLKDAGDPVELAGRYGAEGADELVFLDITASSDKRRTASELAHRTSEEIFIPFTIGGGIKELEDARGILREGADKVSINTAAVERPELVLELSREFGAQCVVVAIDARQCKDAATAEDLGFEYEVVTHGGRTPVKLDAVKWAQRAEALGAGEILLTSMDRDGTKKGYDLRLIELVSSAVNIPVIASGGAGNLGHLVEGAGAGASAVLVASLFHFGEYTIAEAKEYMKNQGLGIRI